MVSFSSPYGAKPVSPPSVSFAGKHQRPHSGPKSLPKPVPSSRDMRAMADALDSDSDSSESSLGNSFCSTVSKSSLSSSHGTRESAHNLRNVDPHDVRLVLSWLGFAEPRQKGSHHQWISPTRKGSLTVPDHGRKHSIGPGLMNNILQQMKVILNEEQSGLPGRGGLDLVDKETICSWVNDPKGNKHEIHAIGEALKQNDPKQTGPHKKRAASY